MQKRIKKISAILLFLSSYYSMGQLPECATIATQKQSSHAYNSVLSIGSDSVIRCVAIQVHIIRKTDGSGGFPISDVIKELDTVNHFFKNANIRFVVKSPPIYIDKDSYYDTISGGEHMIIYNTYAVPNIINIFFSPGVMACGYSSFPGGPDYIFMNNFCASNGSTLTHELGHYFSLYHTHEAYFGAELVNGSNCATSGDFICDTPADPNIFGQVNSSCQYTGTALDANGTPYSPMTNNIMSYSRQHCRDSITPGQYMEMYICLIIDRAYLDIDTCYIATNVNSYQAESEVDVFPVPAIDAITVNIKSSKAEPGILYLLDNNGKMVYSQNIRIQPGKNTVGIEMNNYSSGIYVLHIISGEKSVHKKIIKS